MNLKKYSPNLYENKGNSLYEITVLNSSEKDYHLVKYKNVDTTNVVGFSSYSILTKKNGSTTEVFDTNHIKRIKIQISPANLTKEVRTEIIEITNKTKKHLVFSIGDSITEFKIKDQIKIEYLNPKRRISSKLITTKSKSDSLNFRKIIVFNTSIPMTFYQKRYDYYGKLREEGKCSNSNFIWNGWEVDLTEIGIWKIYNSKGDFIEKTIYN